MSSHVQVIIHKGHKILFADCSGLKPAEIVAEINGSTQVMIAQKINLLCNDISNTTSDDSIKRAAAESVAKVTAANGKIHSSIVGLRGIQKILANAIVRDTHFASSKEDALDWLVKQVS
ncbi:hypothetical protein [Holophaga foetida]|uniref:hypothetical protein n=1 Tax=Holophaga foetida TaxID=35839 RepID=UPI0002474311|nr:hypothetical protein [Holophaga foetida]